RIVFRTCCGIAQSGLEVVPKAIERECLSLGAASPRVQQVVRGYPERPGAESAVAAERPELRDDPYENLLRRIFGVRGMPEHPDRHIVDVVANRRDQRF